MLKINGKKYPIYTLDFETYYEQSSGYSLRNKRYNTSQYIKDPLFKAHGVGIKKGTGKTRWITKNIKEELQALPWDKSALLGHNTYFDGLILSHHYGVQPAFLLDTMCMAKAVHGANSKAGLDFLARLHGLEGKVKGASLVNTMGKVQLSATELRDLGEYCKDDCDDTRALFDIFYSHVPDDELRLIDLTVRMFTRPLLRLDVPRAQAEYEKEVREKQEALDYVSSICTLKDLTSNDKFADLLEKHDYPPPMKVSLTTNKPAYAFAKTDLDFIDMQENGPPIIRALCDARVRNKTSTNETRALRFIQEGANNCPIPVMLNYCGAHTFRWSGGNKINLQNLMRGGELRRSLLAPKGYHIVVADSAQIEARVLAWLAGEQRLVDAFANGEDVYKLMASAIYNIPLEEVTKEQRFVGKIAILGLGYGMGAQKFDDTLAKGAMGPKLILPPGEAKRIVKMYRATNRHIELLWQQGEAILIDMIAGREGAYGPISWGKDYIRMPNGLFMHYTNITGEIYTDRYGRARLSDAHYEGKGGKTTYIYGALLIENIVQCLARCIVADQMLVVADQYPVVTMSHDEIVTLAKVAQAKKCLAFMIKIMSTPPKWGEGIPLGAEGGTDVCYSK